LSLPHVVAACETQQARLFDVVDARLGDEEELTRPNRVVCADTAAKGVSAGSAESMIGDRRRGWVGARCAEEKVLLRQADLGTRVEGNVGVARRMRVKIGLICC